MRRAKRLALGLLAFFAALLALIAFPRPLFAYHVEYRNYEIWSDRPIDPAIVGVLDDATRRLATSELHDPDAPIRLFICNEPWRMRLLSMSFAGAMGGVAYGWLTGNIFLREADIAANRIIAPGGARLADAEARPLSYFIAHEATHVMQSRAFGRLVALRSPDWLIEGHADHVAKAGDFDFEENRRLLIADDPRLDYARSGLYRRYHLMVAHLLERERRPLAAIYADPPDARDLLPEIERR